MTNKNPFEIRLDILKMARDMLDKELELETQKYLQRISVAKETNIGNLDSVVEDYPSMYTSNDVVVRASSLYNFVADSSTSSQIKHAPDLNPKLHK